MLVDCNRCAATVDASVVASYRSPMDDDGFLEEYSLLKCPRCGRPFVIADDMMGEDEQRVPMGGPNVLFPQPIADVSGSLPPIVSAPYGEARKCFRNHTYTASVMMCRKAIEAMCREHGVDLRLAKALAKLRDDGVIEKRLFEWADELRLAGNDATHDVESSVERRLASDVLEFTDALFEYIYTFQEKFEAFKKRRRPPPAPLDDNIPF